MTDETRIQARMFKGLSFLTFYSGCLSSVAGKSHTRLFLQVLHRTFNLFHNFSTTFGMHLTQFQQTKQESSKDLELTLINSRIVLHRRCPRHLFNRHRRRRQSRLLVRLILLLLLLLLLLPIAMTASASSCYMYSRRFSPQQDKLHRDVRLQLHQRRRHCRDLLVAAARWVHLPLGG